MWNVQIGIAWWLMSNLTNISAAAERNFSMALFFMQNIVISVWKRPHLFTTSTSWMALTGCNWCYMDHWHNIWSLDMLGGLSYYLSRVTARVSSLKQICHLEQNEPHNNVTKHLDFDNSAALQLHVCIFSILLLTLSFPVVLGDNSSCSSQYGYWCVSNGSGNPCTFYSSQTGSVGQLCSCSGYGHNLTVCLNNVSVSIIFKLKLLMLKLLGIIKFLDKYLCFQ